MKHIITLLAIAFAALTLSAKEVVKNPVTGMTLSENLGVYTITGKSGVIALGTKEQAKEFLSNSFASFTKENINKLFKTGENQFNVGEDEDGLYIIKVGLGGAKLRQSDIILFGSSLGVKSILESDAAKQMGNALKKGANWVGRKLTEITE
jgi:hypothetical protein